MSWYIKSEQNSSCLNRSLINAIWSHTPRPSERNSFLLCRYSLSYSHNIICSIELPHLMNPPSLLSQCNHKMNAPVVKWNMGCLGWGRSWEPLVVLTWNPIVSTFWGRVVAKWPVTSRGLYWIVLQSCSHR